MNILLCSKVAESKFWINDSLVYTLDRNRRTLSEDEVLLIYGLLSILNGRKSKPNEENRFIWWRHKDDFFIKDCYKRIRESYLVKHSLDHIKVNSLNIKKLNIT